MAKRVKFPLIMANGTQVRTLEELKESFDLVSVLSYYDNGRLHEWLADRYYDEEVDKIKALDSSAADFKQSLCDIFGVSYSEHEIVSVELSDISSKNERYERLKTFTADDNILANVDSVAFNQEELADLLDEDVKVIYLCGKQFVIPGSKEGVTYIGVNNPKVNFSSGVVAKGVALKDVELNIDDIIHYAKAISDPVEAVKLWRMAVELGDAEAQFNLGVCYANGIGVETNEEESLKWYRKAAEQGYAEAQCKLGEYYSTDYDPDSIEYKKAVEWFSKAANQGLAEAQFTFGKFILECYYEKPTSKEAEKGVEWLLKAAEQEHVMAQYRLGEYYYPLDAHSIGVMDKKEAVKWYRKAADQGLKAALLALVKLEPKSLELAESILCVIRASFGDYCIDLNLDKIQVDIATGNIQISYCDLGVEVKREVLSQIGAKNIRIETCDEVLKTKNLYFQLSDIPSDFINSLHRIAERIDKCLENPKN